MSQAVSKTLRVADLSEWEVESALEGAGLPVILGPFVCRLQVDCPALVPVLHRLYANYELAQADSVFTFHPRLQTLQSWGPERWRRVRFSVDGKVPHEDMPFAHALPTLEWGINLVIAMRAHWYLMLHAAVLEKNGFALVLPGTPGSGKTTLAAALSAAGWRLFSDEFGLVRGTDPTLVPVPRPMVLKNESIEVIRERVSDRFMGPSIAGTRKGTVAHFVPGKNDIARAAEVAPPRWVIFPTWSEGANCELAPVDPIEGFMGLSTNAFNYELLGESAFKALAGIVDRAAFYRLRYTNLDDAIDVLDELADEVATDV